MYSYDACLCCITTLPLSRERRESYLPIKGRVYTTWTSPEKKVEHFQGTVTKSGCAADFFKGRHDNCVYIAPNEKRCESTPDKADFRQTAFLR
jgi:hypothetical protein